MKGEIEHTSTMLGSQNMKSSQRMVSVVEPYELPEGWKWVQQNEVCKLTDGEKRTGTEFPYLEVKYLRGKKEKDFVSIGKFIKAGTKVILVDGENSGEVFTVPEDGFMGSTFKALEISNVNENYLQYFIHTKKDLYRNNKKGSAIPHLDKKLFFTMPFPLPPTLAEQQHIVNRIESMFAKLDEAKEKAQNVVDGFETRKAAILHKAFTGELTAKWRKENGVSDDSWKEKTLGEICSEIKIGPFGSLLHEDDYIENGIPLVNPKHISNQLIKPDTKVSISNEKAEELKSYRLLKNDIVLGRRGEMGRCAPVSENENGWLCGTGSMILRLKPEYQARIYSILISSHKSVLYFEENAVGTTLKNLNEKIVKNLPMPIISLPEQQEIVRILDTVLEKESRAKEAAQTVLDQITLLKKSILARAFRGEL